MKRINKYKMIASVMVLFLVVSLIPFTQILSANEKRLEVTFVEEKVDETTSKIKMEIKAQQHYTVNAITLPSNEIVSEDNLQSDEVGNIISEYATSKNGSYKFKVQFQEKVFKENVYIETKNYEEEYSYTVASFKAKEDVAIAEDNAIQMERLSQVYTVGEDYIKNTGEISSITLSNTSNPTNVMDAGKNSTIKANLVTRLKAGTTGVSATKVWMGVRIELPKYSSAQGEWLITAGTYGWLTDLATGTKAVQPMLKNNVWVLEGRVLMQDNGSIVVPGNINIEFGISNSYGVNDESQNIKISSWFYSDDSVVESTNALQVKLKATPIYDIRNVNLAVNQVLSGYYNKTTNDFSVFRPSNMSGYTYGRIYRSGAAVIKVDPGNEALSAVDPVSYDMTYKVTKKDKNGNTVEENDADLQPILLGSKQNLSTQTESQLTNSIIRDMTFGGLVDLNLSLSSNGQGAYTFSEPTANKLHVSMYLDAPSLSMNSRNPGEISLLFVPLDTNDTATTNRKLVVEYENFNATSYTGVPITDSNMGNNITSYNVTPYILDANGDGGAPNFKMNNSITTSGADTKIMSHGGSGVMKGMLTIGDNSRVLDYNINAINTLVKFDAGIKINKVTSNVKKEQYTGSINVLYAVKSDGTKWQNDYEMNQTQDDALRYYNSVQEAEANGVIVGVLFESRGGVWISETMFQMAIINFVEENVKTESIAMVTDMKIWRGSKRLSESDTYKNTNGAAVSKFAITPTESLFPYESVGNTSGYYQRWQWQSDGTYKKGDQNEFGDTLFVVGQSIVGNNVDSKVLNGSNKTSKVSTYTISNKERISDRVFSFDVKNPGNNDIRLSVNLHTAWQGNSDKLTPTGKVLLSTKDNPVVYTPNANPAMAGTFSGGIEINPNDFTINGEGQYQIYFSLLIGTPDNVATDIDQGTYQNSTVLTMYNESKKFAELGSNMQHYQATVVKFDINGVNKRALNKAAKDEVGYELSFTSGSQKMDNVFMLDVLPFNGDGRGSNFNGTFKVKNNIVPVNLITLDASNCKVDMYYTVDAAIQTAGVDNAYATVDIFKGKTVADMSDGMIAGNSKWYQAIDNGDGTWSIPGALTPTAILFCGNLAEKSEARIELTLSLSGQKQNDVYTNTATGLVDGWNKPQETSKTPVSIVSRTIMGTAWIDEDNNHLFSNVDSVMPNVEVTLYKKDGTQITKNVENETYQVKTNSKGEYAFTKVPFNAEGYYVCFSNATFATQYSAVQQYANGATNATQKNDDSDTKAIINSGVIETMQSDVFELYSDEGLVNESIVEQKYTIDSGVKRATIEFAFNVSEKDIVVPINTSIADIKQIINAKAKITVDGLDNDISDTIDYSEFDAFNTNQFGNTITFTLRVKNPLTLKMETKQIKVKIADAVIISTSDLNLVVGDSFDPLTGVTIKDSDGNTIPVTNAMIKANTVPLVNGNATQRGNYIITYEFEDARGHKASYTRNVHVHDKLQLEGLKRVDVIQNNTTFKPNTAKAYYINSNGERLEVVVNYPSSIDLSVVKKNKIALNAIHPINNVLTNGVQEIYVHGDIEIQKPNPTTIKKVKQTISILDITSASYLHVNDDGTISRKKVELTCETPNVTSDEIGFIDTKIQAKVTVVNGLDNSKSDIIRVGFEGYPYIEAISSLTFTGKVDSLETIKKQLQAKAMLQNADGSRLDLTNRIDYSDLTKINLETGGTYTVTLSVKDKDGNVAIKMINITIKNEKPVETERVIVVAKDIPLSKTINGITNDLVKSFISAKTESGKNLDFEIVEHNVEGKVGTYYAKIRFMDGSELTVEINVVDDLRAGIDPPHTGIEDCQIQWYLLILFALFGIYATVTMLYKNRENNKTEK